MSPKSSVNHGLQIGTQNNRDNATTNNAGRDIRIDQSQHGISMPEFQSLLGQIQSQLQNADIPKDERQDIESIVAQVLKQTHKDQPKKSLIVEPLKTAFELVVQAAGASRAATYIVQLLQNAIMQAQNLL